MKLRRLSMANARSFLEPTTLFVEGDISIVVGPNGGGKTNLLDIGAYALRKHLMDLSPTTGTHGRVSRSNKCKFKSKFRQSSNPASQRRRRTTKNCRD